MNCHRARAEKEKGKEWSQLWETKLFFTSQGIKAFLLKHCNWFCSAVCWQLHILESFILWRERKFASWHTFVHRPLPFSNNYSANLLLPSTTLPIKSRRQRREDGSVCVLPASAGHVDDSVHPKGNACWPAAVVSRNRTVKCVAVCRNFCLLNFPAASAPYLMSVGVRVFC